MQKFKRGDLVYYIRQSDCKQIFGVVVEHKKGPVWAHWKNELGKESYGWMPERRVYLWEDDDYEDAEI